MSTIFNKIFNRFCFIVLFFLLQFFSNANENDQADSLLIKTKYHWENDQKDSSAYYAQELLVLSHINTENNFYALANYYLGRYYQNKGLIDSSNYYLKEGVKFFNQNDTLKSGITHFLIGVNFNYKNEIDSALLHYHKSNNYLKLTSDSVWNSVLNNYLSITYFEMGNYPLALLHSQKSLNFLKTSIYSLNIGNIYNTIGNIYRKMKDTEKEKLAYQKAIQILSKLPVNLALAMAYNNLSEIYINKGAVDLGFNYLEKAKNIYNEINYPLGLCSYYAVKSHYYFYKEPPSYDSVIALSKQSAKIADEYQDYRQFADASNYLGRAYINKKYLVEAENILLRAYEKAQQYYFKNEESNLAKSLADLYETKADFQKANRYLKLYQQLNDSLYNEEKLKQFTSLDLKYQYEQKLHNDSLKNQLEKTKLKLEFEAKVGQLELEKKNELYIRWLLFSIFTITVLIIVILYLNTNRKRIIKEKELQLANEKIKLKNQEISYHLLSQTRFSHQLEELKEKLSAYTNKFRAKKDREQFENILYHLSKQKTNPLDEFEEIFKSIYPGFFENLILKYPDLTSRELQICALIRLNFSTKDISTITNLAVNTLETSRYRIRKKLKLQSNEQLYAFLLKF